MAGRIKRRWYFYVLQCKDHSLYTGITTDVERRIKEHNEKKGAKYTRSRLPVGLIYSREMENRSHASKVEAAFKKLTREAKWKRLVEMVDEDMGWNHR